MLEKCFQVVHGIGETTEKKLWNAGIKTWNDVFHKPRPAIIPRRTWHRLTKDINLYQKLLSTNNYTSLNQKIPGKFMWMAIPNFIGKIAYIDIETTGLSRDYHQITTIAVYDGKSVSTFVHGKNLDDFKTFISNYPAIATFYGKGFDVPFIRSYLNMDMPQIHFDVCFLLKKLGIKGGLKKIERQLGMSRGIMSELNGFHAVVLWKRYKTTGNEEYLDTLLAYNIEDVLNLEFLLNYAYNEIMRSQGITGDDLPYAKAKIDNPFEAHHKIVSEVKNENPFA